MKSTLKKTGVVFAFLLIAACSRVPLSNRKQVNLLPESELVSMSLTEYRDFLNKNPAESPSEPDAQLVKKVGSKIQSAIITYLNQHKLGDRVSGYNWEFNLVNNKEVNAWCMPGGKVVVYSGLLPITKTEGALAIVMGHEIAHAVARHGNERMSQQLLAQAGGVALNVALANRTPQAQQAFMTAYGIGSQVGVLLPFSRLQESEADKLGLIFAAMAGYDPREAPDFWRRMSQSGGAKPPELLSTHPSDETRIRDINKFMPEALKYYKGKS